jgi:hypothetical protein
MDTPTLNYPCPLTLKCTVTGESVTYSDPEYIKTRIEKAGGLEQLMTTYVSRAGKRQLKGPTPVVSGKTWKGEPIAVAIDSGLMEAKDSSTGLTIMEQAFVEDGVKMVHREFVSKLKDTVWICHVYAPDLRHGAAA